LASTADKEFRPNAEKVTQILKELKKPSSKNGVKMMRPMNQLG